MARLTLCMIVKNEEDWLRDCLASAAPAVDRMVIVDTGSRDATCAIAREFGAEVIDFAWVDDFSAARNAGLERIEDGYVLVLDADERLTDDAARALREAADREQIDLGLLPLHDAATLDADPKDVLSGAARRGEPIWLPRFLRRTPDLGYEGIVHESVARWASRQTERRAIDAPIIHYGAVDAVREARGKATRNRELLARRCAEQPDDPMAHAYLSAELRRAGELPAAFEAARGGWRAWRRQRTRPNARCEAALPATMAAHLAILAGEFDEAEGVLREALAAEAHPNLNLLSGVLIEQRWLSLGGDASDLESAARHYTRCLALHGGAYSSEVMPGATSWQAATRLGSVELLRSNAQAALAAFEHALASDPELREALLGRVEARLAAGNTAPALSALEPLLCDHEPDGWLLAAEASRAAGTTADTAIFVERSRSVRAAHPFVGKHRERRLSELEESLAGADTGAVAKAATGGSADTSPPSGAPTPDEICVFAWPRYDEASDLDVLLGRYGKLLCEHPNLVLCLRHDARADGTADLATARLEAAFARHLGPGSPLSVILVDQALESQREIAALAGPHDVALELPSSRDEPLRRRFLDDLGARRAASTEDLQSALAH